MIDVEIARFMQQKWLQKKYSIQELKELKESIKGKKELCALNAKIINILRDADEPIIGHEKAGSKVD